MKADDVKVVSFLPGRVRLKVEALKRDAVFAQAVRDDLGAVPGIREVDIKGATGSVLIRYDRKAVSSPESLAALEEVLGRHFPSLDVSRLRGWLSSNA